MDHSVIKEKVITEIAISRRGLGAYRMFSFVYSILNDIDETNSFLQKEGYEQSEVLKMQNEFLRKRKCKNENQVLVADGTF